MICWGQSVLSEAGFKLRSLDLGAQVPLNLCANFQSLYFPIFQMGMWACTLQSHAGKLKEIICIKYLVYHGGSARVVFFVLYFSFFLKQEIQGYYPSSSEGRQTENHNHRKLTNLITRTTALSNSMKLWSMPCRATQDGRVMVESSNKTWFTGEENDKPLQYACLENPMNIMKRQKDMNWKMNSPDR